ncbi:Retrovirus-related Pol polyprotein from transposon RE1 [Vitis vinifera]|uniref:Retrovirus-related Pol polyprotein from transposon RE1 n=1 Tax=Vitis vinifera TaxID=29760 RepID=A0A438F5Q2_VITVI|nr:Retrovirus-related Pol polyprotein from transposon RE1 [Vitis vinifera]
MPKICESNFVNVNGTNPSESTKRIELNPWELQYLLSALIQTGLLFRKPTPPQEHSIIDHLKTSISRTRLVLSIRRPPWHHPANGVTMGDILDPIYVPRIMSSFFPLHETRSFHGVSEPLLAVQVTELVDGIFVGCTMNHVVSDGTSFQHFFKIIQQSGYLDRALFNTYAKPSRGRIMSLKGILDNLHKGETTITEYMQLIKCAMMSFSSRMPLCQTMFYLQSYTMDYSFVPICSVNNSPSTFCLPTAYFSIDWLLDYGASHHVTSDLQNLFLHYDSTGHNDIMIGDDTSLPITHTGSSTLQSSPHSFLLHDDLRTGATLLIDNSKDGVYKWLTIHEKSKPLLIFASIKASTSNWHHHLGHPSTKLESKSKPCVFIGYSLSQSAYICLDPTIHKTYTSRHVKFVESIFPFATSNPPPYFSFIESGFSPHLSTLAPIGTPPLTISLASPPSGNLVPYLETQASNDNRGFICLLFFSSPNISVQMPCLCVPNPYPCQPTVSHSPPFTLLLLPILNPPSIPRVNPLNCHSMITRDKNNIVKPSTKLTMFATTHAEPITKPTCVS